jgi:arsenate reductase (thioredoxin)
MRKTTVLFVCIHNSARSQMAAAYLQKLGQGQFEVESAGIEPGTLNPLVVEAMRLDGIDISGSTTQSVFDLFKAARLFHYVISVCDEAAAERCPIFPGVTKRLNWSFPDPSTFKGSHDERLRQTVAVRDQVRARVEAWLRELGPQDVRV